ncbi:DUF2062 domain-containing protein, partial [Mesorhizobium sp. M8A.F.Ca.ET.023.02.2.1]
YGIARWGMNVFREQRRKRLAERARRREHSHHPGGSVGSAAQ